MIIYTYGISISSKLYDLHRGLEWFKSINDYANRTIQAIRKSTNTISIDNEIIYWQKIGKAGSYYDKDFFIVERDFNHEENLLFRKLVRNNLLLT